MRYVTLGIVEKSKKTGFIVALNLVVVGENPRCPIGLEHPIQPKFSPTGSSPKPPPLDDLNVSNTIQTKTQGVLAAGLRQFISSHAIRSLLERPPNTPHLKGNS